MGHVRCAVRCALGLLALSGCSHGLSQLRDSVSRFDEGAHAVAGAETNFLLAVRTADCESQFYHQAYDFALGTTDALDLGGPCVPAILDDRQLEIRRALMDAITLYADKLQTLVTRDDDQQLDANGRALAGQVNAFARGHGVTKLSVASEVEAAVIELTDLALDAVRFESAKRAAASMARPLGEVVHELERENSSFAPAIAAKVEGLEPQLHLAAVAARQHRGAASFLDVIEARRILLAADPFGATRPPGAAPGSGSDDVAGRLDAALEAVVQANAALAQAGTGGLLAAVNDLIAKAQSAQSLQATLAR